MKKECLIALVITCVSCSGIKDRNMHVSRVTNLHDEFISTSHVEIPISINLKVLEKQIQAKIPVEMVEIDERLVCVKAKWFKTKVPFFEGWKLKTRMLKTKITPEIKCDVTGWVRRDGQVNVSGFDSTLRIAIPIKAKITGRVSGISETAVTRATVFFNMTPVIDENWNLDLKVSTDFSWTQRPTLKLFDLVPITIGSKVEPILRKLIDEIAEDVPKMAADLNLRNKMERVWAEAQSPVVLNKDPRVSILYRPISANYSGFEVKDNILRTSLMTKGSVFAFLDKPNTVPQVTLLPRLNVSSSSSGSYKLLLPILLPYEAMTQAVRQVFPDGHTIEVGKEGVINLSNPVFSLSKKDKLKLSIDVSVDNRSRLLRTIDVFDWLTYKGTLTFLGVPTIDENSKTLSVRELEYDAVSDSRLQDLVVHRLGVKPIKRYFESLAIYEFADDVDRAINSATVAMNTQLDENLLLVGHIYKTSVLNVDLLTEHLLVKVKLQGTARIELGI